MSEETWEKRELDRPDWVSRLVVSANKGRDGAEVTLPTWIVDRIIAAHNAESRLAEAEGLIRELEADKVTLRRALAEAGIVLEALHMAGGTGVQQQIGEAVIAVRAAIAGTGLKSLSRSSGVKA